MPSLREISKQTFPAVPLTSAGLRCVKHSSHDPSVVAQVMMASSSSSMRSPSHVNNRSGNNTAMGNSMSSVGGGAMTPRSMKFDDSLCRSTRSREEYMLAVSLQRQKASEEDKRHTNNSDGEGQCPAVFEKLYGQQQMQASTREQLPQLLKPVGEDAARALRQDYAQRHNGTAVRSQWSTSEEAAAHYYDDARKRAEQADRALATKRDQEIQLKCKQVGSDRKNTADDDDSVVFREPEEVVRHLTEDSSRLKERQREQLRQKYVEDVQAQNRAFIAKLPGSARSKRLISAKASTTAS